MSGCVELNLWRVKVSVPLAICVRIRTLSLPQLFLPFPIPSLSISQVARATTHKNNDGVIPRPHPLSGAESWCSRLCIAHCRSSRAFICTPNVSTNFPPFRVLLTYLTLHSHRHCEPCQHPLHVQPLEHGALFFFLSQFPQTYSTVLPHHRQCLNRLTNHDTPSATACWSTTPRCGPPCATGKSGSERAATTSHTPVTRTFRGGNWMMHEDDHVDVTSTTAPTGQRCNTHGDDDEHNDGSGDVMRTDGSGSEGGGCSN